MLLLSVLMMNFNKLKENIINFICCFFIDYFVKWRFKIFIEIKIKRRYDYIYDFIDPSAKDG